MRGTIIYVPEDVATTPKTGECIVDHWWTVHPEKGVMFYAQLTGYARSEAPAPQCNRTRDTAERLQRRLWPDCETKLIPVVYLSHAEKEFARLRDEALRVKRRAVDVGA